MHRPTNELLITNPKPDQSDLLHWSKSSEEGAINRYFQASWAS